MSLTASGSARFPPEGVNPELYPDLVAAGGMRGALEQVAAELGLDRVEVWDVSEERSEEAGSGSATDRTSLSVFLGSQERCFIFSGWSRGVELITGSTGDLGEVARVAVAWRTGASLHELRALGPFV